MNRLTTDKGVRLAYKLAGMVPPTVALAITCSKIARHAKTYAGIQVEKCNGPSWAGSPRIPPDQYHDMMVTWESEIEKRDKRYHELICIQVRSLPATEYGAFHVSTGGDPRGCVVKLIIPARYRARYADDWERLGICVA